MASEDPVPEETITEEQEAPVQEKKPPELFRIHSMVREIATRNHRMKAAVHHRFVQRFGGGAVTVRRSRPATVTKEVVLRFLPELKKAQEDGKIVVKTMIGELVNLDNFEVTPLKPIASPPQIPLLDSAANDKTFEQGVGNKVEQFEGGGVPGGAPPPLNIRPPIMSDDEPIRTSGDPVAARAALQQKPDEGQVYRQERDYDDEQSKLAKEEHEAEDDFAKEELDPNEEPLGDDEPTEPDALADTGGSSKRSKKKKGGHK